MQSHVDYLRRDRGWLFQGPFGARQGTTGYRDLARGSLRQHKVKRSRKFLLRYFSRNASFCSRRLITASLPFAASVFSLKFDGRKCEVVLTAATDTEANGKIIHVKPSSGSVRPQQYIVNSKTLIFTPFLSVRNLFLQWFIHLVLFPKTLSPWQHCLTTFSNLQ